MVPYDHKVQYYETDGMGIVHHSNYIRWFEEARVDLLEQLGFGYDLSLIHISLSVALRSALTTGAPMVIFGTK